MKLDLYCGIIQKETSRSSLEIMCKKINSLISVFRKEIDSIFSCKAQESGGLSHAEIIQKHVEETSNPPSESDSKTVARYIGQEIKRANVPNNLRKDFEGQMVGVGG